MKCTHVCLCHRFDIFFFAKFLDISSVDKVSTNEKFIWTFESMVYENTKVLRLAMIIRIFSVKTFVHGFYFELTENVLMMAMKQKKTWIKRRSKNQKHTNTSTNQTKHKERRTSYLPFSSVKIFSHISRLATGEVHFSCLKY